MPFRFRRRVGLPGLHLNLSRSGVSATVGLPGFRLTLGKRPAINVGIPGTGISFRESLGSTRPAAPTPPATRHVHVRWWVILAIAVTAWVVLAR